MRSWKSDRPREARRQRPDAEAAGAKAAKHKPRPRVVVIGMVERYPDDRFTLAFIASQLMTIGRWKLSGLLSGAILGDTLDIYDMQTRPEKGDALDHLGPDVGLVVALHLYGIDKLPVPGVAPLHEQVAA